MKNIIKIFVVFAISNLFTNVIFGESASLKILITEAKQNNPEIIAVREKWNATKSKIWQERTWDNPQFFIDYQRMPKNNFNLNDAEEKMFGITQMVPFPGKLSIKGKIAKYDNDIAEIDYKNIELKVLSDLKSIYSMYFYINKSIETYKQISDYMQDFSKVAESKYIVGKASQGDVLRAQVEFAKMLSMVITMKQEKETVKAELNSIIGKDPDSELGEPEDLMLKYMKNDWNEIKQLVIENNFEIKKDNINVSKSKWSKKSAYTEFLPDFDLTYRRRKMESAMDTQDFMLGFTFPLWFWKPMLAIKEMSSELKMSESEKKNTELMNLSQAKEEFLKLKTLERLIELYRTDILGQAEQSQKVTEASYRVDKEDFLQVLDTTRTLLDLRLEYYRYITEYYQNLSKLEKITGVELSGGGSK